MLEVDDEGGRMFLRVLIHLTMHDYPPLISGSLQLLFKHFSQRQEVLHTFKQVTLERLHLMASLLWEEIQARRGVGFMPQTSCTGKSLGMSLQVQLLISAQDVENYKVIKSELDKLRTMVEKSELWVDKKGSVKGDSNVDGNKKEKKEVRAVSSTWNQGGEELGTDLSMEHAQCSGKRRAERVLSLPRLWGGVVGP